MIALVDESILLSGSGAYILGAVVIPLGRKAEVWRRARRLTPRRRQFHWKNEEPRERMAMTELIRAEGVHLFAYVNRPVVRRDHERAREGMLDHLLGALACTPTLDLLIESRQRHNDMRDRHRIARAQMQGRASPALSYDHSDPVHEPLLWLPDGLAGAVLAQVRGDDQYTSMFSADQLRIIRTPQNRP